MQEQLEKKKAEYAERMKNKVAAIHKEAEESSSDISDFGIRCKTTSIVL
jgi:hypothetical protein